MRAGVAAVLDQGDLGIAGTEDVIASRRRPDGRAGCSAVPATFHVSARVGSQGSSFVVRRAGTRSVARRQRRHGTAGPAEAEARQLAGRDPNPGACRRRPATPGGWPRRGTRCAAPPRRSRPRAGSRVATSPCSSQSVVGRAHARGQLHVVVAQFRQHVERRDEVGIVVENALQPADVTDRAHRRAADLAHPLGDGIGGGQDLRRPARPASGDSRENAAPTCASGSSWS